MKENYWNQSISNTIHVQSECSSVKKRHLFCPKSDKNKSSKDYTDISISKPLKKSFVRIFARIVPQKKT